jgi:prepilin-type N-terminal cleavage/methylation domain-containing protein
MLPRNFKKPKSGFTLIELLVVIAVMGMIIGAIVPSFRKSRSSTRDGKRKAELQNIRSALEIYRSDQTPPSYPTADANANPVGLSPTYMPSWPADPMPSFYYRYIRLAGGAGYALCARMESNVNIMATLSNCGGGLDCGTSSNLNCNYEVTNQ